MIPQKLFHCAVFGWLEDSFVGIEQESAYNISAGYLKGDEQVGAGARLMLNVMARFNDTSKQWKPKRATFMLPHSENCMWPKTPYKLTFLSSTIIHVGNTNYKN